jgi:hypothetical protein
VYSPSAEFGVEESSRDIHKYANFIVETRVGIHKQFLNPAESQGFWNPRISAGFEPYS